MARGTVAVRFTGDVASLKRSIGDVDSSLGRVEKRSSAFSNRMKAGFAALGAGAVVFGKQSVDAFVEAEQAQASLAAAFEKFPALANGNIDALRELNSELAKKTKYDDDATASGQAVLAQFGLNQQQLEQLTPLLQDYAARTGKDLPSAAKDLGKAIQGQGRALKNVGINFKDTGSAAGNFDELMAGLNDQVGGFAEKQGKTAAGQAAILQNQFGELQEELGARLVPALTKLAKIGLRIIDFLSNLSPEMKTALGVVAGLGAAVFVLVKAVQAWRAAQAALNIVLSLNPIFLVVAAVAAFVAGLVIAYQNVEGFRDLVDGAFRLIKDVIMGTFNWVRDNWPLLLAVLTGPFGLAVLAISSHWETIKNGATEVKDWIVGAFDAVVNFFTGMPDRIRGAIDGILAQLDRMLGPVDEALGLLGKLGIGAGNLTSDVVRQIGAGQGTGALAPQQRAIGGPVLAGRSYLVGERGPELLTMAGNGYITPNHRLGGGSTQVIQLVVDGRVLAEAVHNADARGARNRGDR